MASSDVDSKSAKVNSKYPLSSSASVVPAVTTQEAIATRQIQIARLKPVSRLCTANGKPFLSVVVPVGLRPDGYIQVITDPLHDLKAMETDLGMPLKLSLANGQTSYLSGNWDSNQVDDRKR